jgi:hypothetical protein
MSEFHGALGVYKYLRSFQSCNDIIKSSLPAFTTQEINLPCISHFILTFTMSAEINNVMVLGVGCLLFYIYRNALDSWTNIDDRAAETLGHISLEHLLK